MQNLEDLKEQVRKALPELDVVIGWTGGYDLSRKILAPVFARYA